MRKLILTTVLIFSATVSAEGIFPAQPVEMRPGYGADGAGLHMGVPYGLPGSDCVINPVSMTHRVVTQATTTITPGTIITIPATVLFDFDGDFVRPEGEDVLRAKILVALVAAKVDAIQITGHTDSKGTEEYNEDLGLRRATAVAAVLKLLGYSGDLAVATGGETSPLVSNTFDDGSDNPEGRQTNRRVELLVKSVADDVEEITETIVVGRNPQIFHRFSSNAVVTCGADYHGLYGPWFYRYNY